MQHMRVSRGEEGRKLQIALNCYLLFVCFILVFLIDLTLFLFNPFSSCLLEFFEDMSGFNIAFTRLYA